MNKVSAHRACGWVRVERIYGVIGEVTVHTVFNSILFIMFWFAPPSLLAKQLAPCPVLLLFPLARMLTSCLRAVLCLHSAASERHCGIVHQAPAAWFGQQFSSLDEAFESSMPHL